MRIIDVDAHLHEHRSVHVKIDTNFDLVHSRLIKASVMEVQSPRAEPWGKTARYLDPDGNIVSITSST